MSTLQADTLNNRAGTKTVPVDTVIDGSAKAWVNFNGTGTVAIRAAFNVSSITDNGTGDYTVNFTTALSSADYAPIGSSVNNGSGRTDVDFSTSTKSTTQQRLTITLSGSNTLVDVSLVSAAFFR